MILVPQIFNVIANESVRYNCNELEFIIKIVLSIYSIMFTIWKMKTTQLRKAVSLGFGLI